jgi:hypothetical protein
VFSFSVTNNSDVTSTIEKLKILLQTSGLLETGRRRVGMGWDKAREGETAFDIV